MLTRCDGTRILLRFQCSRYIVKFPNEAAILRIEMITMCRTENDSENELTIFL